MIESTRYRFLFHHTPPPDFGSDPLLLLSDVEGNVHETTLENLSRVDSPLVTHSFSLLVDWFRSRYLTLPPYIVDLETACKLAVGRPKSEFEVERPWDMPSMLLPFVDSRYDTKSVRAALATHLAKPPISEIENLAWMTDVAKGLSVLWSALVKELEDAGELRRFFEVEVPAYNTMLGSQYRGIRIDPHRRDSFLQLIEKEYVSAHYQLAIGRGIDVERALADVEYLSGYLEHAIRSPDDFVDPRDLISARKDSDPVCSLLDAVMDARRNRSILLRCIGNDAEYCYPVFDTMGTVTGRILAVDPHLQHLNKRYRNIIQARSGKKLVYVDYSQFEPNIMASISKDTQLLALCNAGDLYEHLAAELCADVKYRKTIKLMFLAYSYGKRIDTLPDFLIGILGSREKAAAMINESFVPLFAGLEKWKSTIESELTKVGRIGSLIGNYRYRTNKGDPTAKERRWAISQVIQGTGSLILKNLINKLAIKLPEISVLLPMHDALLVELPEERADEITAALMENCRYVFSEVCPLVSPSVSEKAFFE